MACSGCILDFNTDNCEVDIEGYAKVVIHSFIIRSTVSQNCIFDADLKNIACRISRDILILVSREANQAADFFLPILEMGLEIGRQIILGILDNLIS